MSDEIVQPASLIMQSLLQTFQDYDFGQLKVIAELWGIRLTEKTKLGAAKVLAQALSDEEFISEILDSLPPEAADVLRRLMSKDGREPLADLERKFGLIREMGPGRRDREKPWREPSSPLEILWYRGLIGRAFADSALGAQEMAYIPLELLSALPSQADADDFSLGFQINQPSDLTLATNAVYLDATTILAYLRKKPTKSDHSGNPQLEELYPFLRQPDSVQLLIDLLLEAEILSSAPLQPSPEATRDYLDLGLTDAQLFMLKAWRSSVSWNDLQHTPGISSSKVSWPNDPIAGRHAVLEVLRELPIDQWQSFEQFVHAIKESRPGFQRRAGEFDSWYLFDTQSEAYLRGYENWDAVEGRYLHFLINGPLHWLGATDLGGPGNKRSAAFKLTKVADQFFNQEHSAPIRKTDLKISIKGDGSIVVPHEFSAANRYQIARFSDWIGVDEANFTYRLSPSSLSLAISQGLQLKHIRALLEGTTDKIPPTLFKALARWEAHGKEAKLQSAYLLQVADVQIMEMLRSNRGTSKYIRETLGPTTAIIFEKDRENLYQACLKAGLLLDI